MNVDHPQNVEKRPGHPAKSHRTAPEQNTYQEASAVNQSTATLGGGVDAGGAAR